MAATEPGATAALLLASSICAAGRFTASASAAHAIRRLAELGSKAEEMKRSFVEILAQTIKRPLGENELGATLGSAF